MVRFGSCHGSRHEGTAPLGPLLPPHPGQDSSPSSVASTVRLCQTRVSRSKGTAVRMVPSSGSMEKQRSGSEWGRMEYLQERGCYKGARAWPGPAWSPSKTTVPGKSGCVALRQGQRQHKVEEGEPIPLPSRLPDPGRQFNTLPCDSTTWGAVPSSRRGAGHASREGELLGSGPNSVTYCENLGK